MKLYAVLPLAALSTAFVLPDEQAMSQIAIESHSTSDSIVEKIPSKDHVVNEFENTFSKLIDTSRSALDQAIDYTTEISGQASKKCHEKAFDAKAWIESASNRVEDLGKHEHHGHHGHCKPNLTVYELISKSKYTTKLAALINEYEEVVTLLNGTAANYTVFAPTDRAFEKIPEDAPKPSKEQLLKVLLYHVSKDFYPAGRVLVTHTVPTLLVGDEIGGESQRLATEVSLKGLTINFYSRIIAIDIVRLGVSHLTLHANIISLEPTA